MSAKYRKFCIITYWLFVNIIRISNKLKLYWVTTCKQDKPQWILIYCVYIAIPRIYFYYARSHAYLFSPRAHFLPTQSSTDCTLWTILTQIDDIIIYNINNILYYRTCGKPIQHCYYYNILYGKTYVVLRRKLVLKLPKSIFLLTYILFNLWKLVRIHRIATSIINR